MRSGQSVEVRTPWAAQGGGLPPLYHWFGGYEFVRETPRGILVRQTVGTFSGVESLYRKSDVRKAHLDENPKRPPREWWYRCVKGVKSGSGAYNPQEVCGALWYRKMSTADKRRITREAESMKQNPDWDDYAPARGHAEDTSRYERERDDAEYAYEKYLARFSGPRDEAMSFEQFWREGSWRRLAANPDSSDVLTTLIVGGAIAGGLWLLLRSKPAAAASTSACVGFDSLNGPLESFGKLKGYDVWVFANKPFSTGWPAPKPEYSSNPNARAYSLADCSFYQWKLHEGSPDAWVKDDTTNAEFDAWRKA